MSINKNIELLIKLNVSTKSSLEVFHKSTRDIDNLNVINLELSSLKRQKKMNPTMKKIFPIQMSLKVRPMYKME